MDDDLDTHVRPATPAERADVRLMHDANRGAWDEAAERYEGWLDEAVALIGGGGSNLFPVEEALIGDLHGWCRRAIHLQCAGGRDTLSLWNLGADTVIGIDFSSRMLELAVHDSGHGLDADQKEKMFEPLYTTKELGHGTGLGLAIVDHIVRDHGGELLVESEPKQGTTVRVRLPLESA